jgi:microsomal dipeptidase-like Zn-dependent dipeptidase
MDANYKPEYRQLPLLAGALLKRGLSEEETAQFLDGNFLRLFREVVR